MKAQFITFEGSEGCGKSTHSKLLQEYLESLGHKVVFLREPGGIKISEKIRAILLDPRNVGMSAQAEMLLYMAARAQVVCDLIKPALDSGKIVICDRFLDSTIAYQGYGLGIDVKIIKLIGRFATGAVSPDLTILMDLPVKKGLKYRVTKDRIEKRPLSYHLKVRQGYLRLARLEPERIKVVKVDKDIVVTQNKIRQLVLQKLG